MVVINNFIVLALLLTNKGKEYVYSHPPLSKRGILKALGQDPSKSDVLTVSTNPDGRLGYSQNVSFTGFSSGIPFLIPPGDGGANGLSFTGGGGWCCGVWCF